MAFVVELLVLELVHHFFIARNLFPPNVYKPLVGHRIIGLGEDGEKVLGHYPRTPTAASDYVRGPLHGGAVLGRVQTGERSCLGM
jgi:hypothetical protein